MPGCCSPPKQCCFVLLCPHFVRSCRVSGGVLGCGEVRRGKGGRLWCLSLDPAILRITEPESSVYRHAVISAARSRALPSPAHGEFLSIWRHSYGTATAWSDCGEMLGGMCPRVLMLLLLEIGSCDCIFRFLSSYPTLM